MKIQCLKFSWYFFMSLIFIVICSVQPGRAQQEQSCAALLKFGVYDQYDTLTETSQFRLFKTWVCESKFSNYQQAESEAQKLGIGVDIFSLDYGGANARTQWQTWSQNFCSSSYEQIQNNYKFRNSIRVISPALMTVVGDCLKRPTKGVLGWIETTKDRTQFIFKVKYEPIGPEINKVKAFSIQFTPQNGASLSNNCVSYDLLSNGSPLNPSLISIPCKVEPSQTVTVVLNSDFGSTSPILDGYIPPEPLPSTIICQLYRGPSDPSPRIDITGAQISTCRNYAKVETDRQKINFSFAIICYDQNGQVVGHSGQNDDNFWPTGCKLPKTTNSIVPIPKLKPNKDPSSVPHFILNPIAPTLPNKGKPSKTDPDSPSRP